jgi:hypothetical protein
MQAKGNTISDLVKSGDYPTLAINVDGPYFPLIKFRKALDSFIDLLTAVDQETSEDGNLTIEWAISSITTASIHVTAVANPVSEEVPQSRLRQVIQTVIQGLEQLQEAPVTPIGFSKAALRHTKVFGEIIDPKDFAEIQFASNGWQQNISPRLAGNINEITKKIQTFYGSIEGKLVSISVAGKQTLGIRSSIEGRTIRCYFKDEMFEAAKKALGHKVYAFGLIRQHSHGAKISIQVNDADEFRVLPSPDEMLSVSEILARLRNG